MGGGGDRPCLTTTEAQPNGEGSCVRACRRQRCGVSRETSNRALRPSAAALTVLDIGFHPDHRGVHLHRAAPIERPINAHRQIRRDNAENIGGELLQGRRLLPAVKRNTDRLGRERRHLLAERAGRVLGSPDVPVRLEDLDQPLDGRRRVGFGQRPRHGPWQPLTYPNGHP